MKILKRLDGPALVRGARALSRLDPRGGIEVSFDHQTGLYTTHGSYGAHAFAHPRRITTLWHGHHVRGRNLAYEYQLDLIPFEDGDWIIDVGANSGDLCLAFNALGRRVNIEAFEPSPGEFAALSVNLQTSTAVETHQAHQVALYNTNDEALTFYLKPGSADSSVVPIANATQTVTVPARRLDDVLAGDTRQFRLMKLEAEGVEPEILQGARGKLKRIEYIAADVGFERGEAQASTLPEVTNLLLDNGFEIVGLEYTRLVVLFRNTAFRAHD